MAETHLSTGPAMVLADGVLVQPPRTINEHEPFPALPPATPTGLSSPGEPADLAAGDQPKRKGRQRLARGLSRMSSFPSLAQFGRGRSSSAPYGPAAATMSCGSLAPSSTLLTTPSSSANSPGLSSSPLSSPAAGRSAEPSSSSPMSHSLSSPGLRMPNSMYNNNYNSDEGLLRKIASAPLSPARPKKSFVALWATLPREIKLHVFASFDLKELVRLSRVNLEFHTICLDGQLWSSFDASEFYRDIPAQALSKILTIAGPFVKNLNLRGCIQIEKHDDSFILSGACQNLVTACLEGSHIDTVNLSKLLRQNTNLVHLNLSGLNSVNELICLAIAESCPQLEVLNLSWCKNLRAKNLKPIIQSCTKLRDLRVGELRSIDDDMAVANALFQTNNLERLVFSRSVFLNTAVLSTMMHGINPEMDHLTNRARVPPRRLRHLDLSHCRWVARSGILSLAHCLPDLEGLVLSGCQAVTDADLIPILESCPKLTHLELEDLGDLTDTLLADHLAKAPCAEHLTHLSLSYCERITDAGVLPLLRACKSLKSLDIDNTRVTDLVLTEAVAAVCARAPRTYDRAARPRPGLNMTVYDCPGISYTGVREVLYRNAKLEMPARPPAADGWAPPAVPTYPTEIVTLKCYYGWQMTVDEHTKRVLRGDFASAARLEQKWGHFMLASEEAGVRGAGGRRRRRRAREAQLVHASEELAGAADVGLQPLAVGRRRARTATCAIM